MNILNYLKTYKDTTFEEMSFNEVDSLILSELSYMNLNMYAPTLDENKFVRLSKMRIYNSKTFAYGSVDAKKNLKMIDLMKHGERFKGLQIGLCKEKTSEGDKKATQFFAVTFILPNDVLYIAYRGTDITINGWKEDFHMTIMDTIPSQRDALAYAKTVLTRINKPYYLGGHSKGGNLAFYTAFNLDNRDFEERLIKVYSFDGPGFKNGVKAYPSYEAIKDKIVKYMTNRDMVGIVYNNFRRNAIIINGTGILLGGHDPFSWQVNVTRARFVRSRRLKAYKNTEVAFNKWLKSVSEEDKVLACDIVFDLLKDAKTVYDLPKAVGKILFHGKEMLQDYTPEEKDRIIKIVKKLVEQFMVVNFNFINTPKKIEKKDGK